MHIVITHFLVGLFTGIAYFIVGLFTVFAAVNRFNKKRPDLKVPKSKLMDIVILWPMFWRDVIIGKDIDQKWWDL